MFGDSGLAAAPASPLEGYVWTERPQWYATPKSITWTSALDPAGVQPHAAVIKHTVPFCKRLERGLFTTPGALPS
jgi:hypothetical protein